MGNPSKPHSPDKPEFTPSLQALSTVDPAKPLSVTRSWVPIRSLGPHYRERIVAHLLALDQNDRYLRFGYSATDSQICKYVEFLDFEHDEVFGIFNRRLQLIAMAHLAHPVVPPSGETAAMSEFGVSVLPTTRKRGFGRRLFEHAVVHARNRGIETLLIHALSENTAMLKIARYAGAKIERNGSESEARLKLPPDTFSSHVGEMVEQQAAEMDYRLKVRSHQVSTLLNVFSDFKTSTGKKVQVAKK